MTTSGVHADVVVPLAAPQARDRLGAMLRAGSDVTPTEPLRLTVGPARAARFPSKHVVAMTTGPRQLNTSHVYALRWEPVGLGAGAYPVFDAKVAVTPIDANSSLLSIRGYYTPPLGAFGAAVDRLAMSRVATATVTSVLRRLAAALASERSTSGVAT